jgi:hypothetical protein
VVQAAHSVEEVAGRLWESFPPARFVSGLVSSDLERGFLLLNLALVAFGAWCYFWPVRQDWPAARRIALIWAGVETVNGIGHPLWSLRQGGYTPGTITAPVLLILAVALATGILRRRS